MVIDDSDANVLDGYFLHVSRGYAKAKRRSDKHAVYVHHLIIGKPTRGFVVDHIDGNKLNNTRSNLRVVTQHVNQANRHRLNHNNTSGERGVYWTSYRAHLDTPWRASIKVKSRDIYLGCFASVEEAAKARADAEVMYYGARCPRPNAVMA